MTNQRSVRHAGPAFIQQRFQPAGRALEKEGFDSSGHRPFYHSNQHSAFSTLPKQLTAKGAKDAK